MGDRSIGMFLGIVCALIWGGQAIVTRLSVFDGLTPADVTILRFLAAGLVLTPILFSRKTVVGSVGWLKAIALAGLAGAPFSFVLVAGAAWAPALHSGVVVQGLTPALALLLGIAIDGDRPQSIRLFGLGLILVGVSLFVWSGSSEIIYEAAESWRGDVLFTLAAAMWASFGFLCKRWRVPPVDATIIVCTLSLLVVPLLFFLPSNLHHAPISAIVLQASYLGILVGAISLWLYTRCIALLGAVDAALFLPLVPVVAGVFGALILGEWPVVSELLAAVATVIGMVFALTGNRNEIVKLK